MLMRPFLSAQEVYYVNQHYMYMLTSNRNSRVSPELWQPNFVGQPVTLHPLRNQFPVRPRPMRPIIPRCQVGWQQDQKEFYSPRKENMDCNDTMLSKCDVVLYHSKASSHSEYDRSSFTKDEFKSNFNTSPKECIEPTTTLTEIKKSFSCPQCKYSTDRKNNLKRHIITMHFDCDRKLECCGASFRSKAKLREHVILFHKDGYRCMTCGRTFCRKALLRRHMAVHSGKKDFLCSLCDYATSHKSNLERHQKVHQKSKGLDSCGNVRNYSHRKVKRKLMNTKFKYQFLDEFVENDKCVPKIHDVYSYDAEIVSDFVEVQNNRNRFSLYGETTTQNMVSSPFNSDYSSAIMACPNESFDNVVTTTNKLYAGFSKDENDNDVNSNDKTKGNNGGTRTEGDILNSLHAGYSKDENGNDVNSNDKTKGNNGGTRKEGDVLNSQGIYCFSDDCVNDYENATEDSFCLTVNEGKRNGEEPQESIIEEACFSEANDLVQGDSDSETFSNVSRIRHKDSKRLCVQPYRCACCRSRFKSQADFHCHACSDTDRTLVGKSDSSYSLVAQIIKQGQL